MGKGDRGAPQSWGMRHWWLEVRGYRWWFHLESLGLASRGLVSDPQLNDLLWNLLGRGGVWGYSYLLDSIMFCPLGREGLTPDSLTQPPVLSLESILPPPSQGHPEGPIGLDLSGGGQKFPSQRRVLRAISGSEWNLEPKWHRLHIRLWFRSWSAVPSRRRWSRLD